MLLDLSKQDTNILKGIALLMLLCHHLFYVDQGLIDDIILYNGYGFVNLLAQACKICVPLFVFLSGYGLMASVEKLETINWKRFYIHRFTKLYSNYWLIWLLFVPVGIWYFGRTFEEVYGDKILFKLPLDLLGLLNCTGGYGYNATWWFYSCIILLYLLFPFILKARNNKAMIFLCFSSSIALFLVPCGPFNPIKWYLFSFVLGCYVRNGLIFSKIPPPNPIFRYMNRLFNGHIRKWEIIIVIGLIFLYVIFRSILPLALALDSIMAMAIIVLLKSIKLPAIISKGLLMLGHHSFNIFLFHTFVYYYYTPDIIYFSRNPLIAFISLTIICLLISIIIEKGKKSIGFNRIEQVVFKY